ncbi:MAG: prolyl oligopeptidase family serine peptidase [Deltaproteobacteria bacterium]|nr:prolyl oligopeptidase family serine peptidase [Deltaproteobacteria bacterium]
MRARCQAVVVVVVCALLLPAAAAPEPAVAADALLPEDAIEIARRRALPPTTTSTTPRFARDGSLGFVSNRDGGPAFYMQQLGGLPRKVAPLAGRFRRPTFSPDGKHVYFTTDDKGDEAFMVRRLDVASGVIDDVAVDGKLKREGPWFAGDTLLFSARPLKAIGGSLFARSAKDQTAKAVFTDATMAVVDVRGDGRQALASAIPLDDALFTVGLPDGAPRRIYGPTDRRVEIYDATYSPDGAAIHVATDDGGELLHLITFDARSGRELHRAKAGGGGEVHDLLVRGRTLAFVINLGTHHELRICDVGGDQCKTAKLPLGSEVPGARHPNSTPGLALSDDGQQLAVEWSTPSSPSQIYWIDAKTGHAKPLDPQPAGGVVDVEVVRVRSFDDVELPTLVYGQRAPGKKAVIVWIHGGFPFASTARSDAWLTMLLAEGYVVVEPNLRGSGGFGRAYERMDDGAKKLDGVRDLRAVAEWVKAQPWADAERMAIVGPSAGGYYALMGLAHQPELWRAGVAMVPMYDVVTGMDGMDADLRLFLEKELAPASEAGIRAAVSPSTYVDRIRAPLFVSAGARDVRTPLAQIEPLVRARRAAGGRVEFMVSTSGHSRDPATFAELSVRVLRFLRTELKRS